ncbi:hypothetical protein VAR608DRAFT_0445 [Variovorax sp. HW608]|nr:hypothetical protein VAR608DRAFT_0445 [Variovorax sp. HW608]
MNTRTLDTQQAHAEQQYPEDGSAADVVYRKVGWRLIPLLFLCYIVACLDRVNVGFAKLQMQGDLQFIEAVYGLCAGIFFFGYFRFEVASNVILHRVDASRWIARIMITWGLLSAAKTFVNSPMAFAARHADRSMRRRRMALPRRPGEGRAMAQPSRARVHRARHRWRRCPQG